ncbi:MAG: sugar transferase [Actinobacteria bacterium]|nr:sugar transferase [Actinomycetota bacterium]
MLKEKAKYFSFLNRSVDHVLIIISAFLAVLVEQFYHGNALRLVDYESLHPYIIPFILIIWQVLFVRIEKKYLYRRTGLKIFAKQLLVINSVGLLILISISFLLKEPLFYRSTIVFFVFISYAFLFGKRLVMKLFLQNVRNRGKNIRNILIVGSKKRAEALVSELSAHSEYGYVISGILDPAPERVGKSVDGYQVESGFDRFEKIVSDRAIDEVFFAMPPRTIPGFTDKMNFLNSIGVNSHLMINVDMFMDGIKSQAHVSPFIEEFYNLPVISFHSATKKIGLLVLKKYLELVICFGMLVVFSPIFLVVPILIKLNSPGSVFFRQIRVGYHGRKFKLIKFRTMYIDAERQQNEIVHLNEMEGPVFKVTNDPRMTKVGGFIRKYSLDELPQLFNIISGDMNLVGPRPLPVTEVLMFEKSSHLRRHSMKPGITGLWQISGRNLLQNFEDWVKLDLEYIDNWSLWLDIKIIFKSIPAMLSGTGK